MARLKVVIPGTKQGRVPGMRGTNHPLVPLMRGIRLPAMADLYGSGGSLGRNIIAGLWTLTYVMCDELVWNCRYNPTFTRFYN